NEQCSEEQGEDGENQETVRNWHRGESFGHADKHCALFCLRMNDLRNPGTLRWWNPDQTTAFFRSFRTASDA
ncbi:MAG TPA: hypothetical protein PLK38_04250, partial [Methanoregulaceae archaeon]|nr:hypothetical protein [Methanoregulaceae archaeon]